MSLRVKMDNSRSEKDIKSLDKNDSVNQSQKAQNSSGQRIILSQSQGHQFQGQRVNAQRQPTIQQYQGQVPIQPPRQVIRSQIPVPRQFHQNPRQLIRPPPPPIQVIQQQFQGPLSQRFQVVAPTQLQQQRPRQDIRVQIPPKLQPPPPQQIPRQVLQQQHQQGGQQVK